MKKIKIEGIDYKIRYEYERDGQLWYVLNCDGGFFGKFGDEFPKNNTIKI